MQEQEGSELLSRVDLGVMHSRAELGAVRPPFQVVRCAPPLESLDPLHEVGVDVGTICPFKVRPCRALQRRRRPIVPPRAFLPGGNILRLERDRLPRASVLATLRTWAPAVRIWPRGPGRAAAFLDTRSLGLILYHHLSPGRRLAGGPGSMLGQEGFAGGGLGLWWGKKDSRAAFPPARPRPAPTPPPTRRRDALIGHHQYYSVPPLRNDHHPHLVQPGVARSY